jgi:bis(5'-nucleosyl)-tetraphosphatase (symmetrical)
MTVYAVGDIQGCLDCLERLLGEVHFSPGQDQLWAVGDLVNRGPRSLDTLRFCRRLGDSFRTVLGNHDLHLLSVAHGFRSPSHRDTLAPVLNAPDRKDLIEWLHHQPLFFRERGFGVVHAGIPPQWTSAEAVERSREVEYLLRGPRASTFLKHMYGNEPDQWRDDLEGPERWRLITNYFTRMRFCDRQGRLELHAKGSPEQPPAGFAPWFAHDNRKSAGDNIIFGHWASLEGNLRHPHLFPLDTGCVWGGRMRLMNLQTRHFSHARCAPGGRPA